jgi:hypothetical protein
MKRLIMVISFFIGALQASNQSFSGAMTWKKGSEKLPFYTSISWKRGLEVFKKRLKERWDVVLTTPRTLKILTQNPSIEAYYDKKYKQKEKELISEIINGTQDDAKDIKEAAELLVQDVKNNFSLKGGIAKCEGEIPSEIFEKINKLGELSQLPLVVIRAESPVIHKTLSGLEIEHPAVSIDAHGIVLFPLFFKEGTKGKDFILHHEMQHLIERDNVKLAILTGYGAFELFGKYGFELNESERHKVEVYMASKLFSLKELQEKRADKIPASKDINIARGGKEFFADYQWEIPGNPHASPKKRYAYLSKIYNLLKSEETIKATADKILKSEAF